MSGYFCAPDVQQDYILVRTLGRGAFGEANLYRKTEVCFKLFSELNPNFTKAYSKFVVAPFI